MESARWERVQAIFHEAVQLPVSEQGAFLESSCRGDTTLIADVSAMLAADARGMRLLDDGLAPIASDVLAADPSTLPSDQFGPYRLLHLLGEGGMGVVYLAERKDVGGQVAIKILRDAWLSPVRRGRFAAEQRLLAQLNHPSIARLYNASTLPDGTPYFVMEYVEGLPLTEYCAQRSSTVEERLDFMRQVCEAVQYAHSRAVIHRDLKPSNILVKEDGSIRLLDFGIAKQLDSLDAPVEQTRTGFRLMTPAYAAPEQVRGDQVGAQTDVYALGLILYELLAGRLPFDLSNLTPLEAATVILEHDPSPPSQSGTALVLSRRAWADLDVLCLKAMHKDPARRYGSAEALIREIDHYLRGEPLDARPDSVGYKLSKFIRRNERAVGFTAAAVLVVLGLITFFTLRLAKARDAALAEAERTRQVQRFTTNLFQGGDEAAGPSDSLKVTTLLDRGVQEAHSLSKDPSMQADMYLTLGNIYQKLGKLDEADTLLQSALQERKKVFGPDSPQAAEALVSLGLLRDSQAKYDEAEDLIRKAIAITNQNSSAVGERGRATAGLGKVLEDRGKYAEAIPMLQEAVRLQSAAGGNEAELAATISELANCNFYLGDYQLSDALNRRVLEMQEKLYGDRHPLIADTLINLGAIQYDLGNYTEAERFDRRALEITQAWYGADNPETASAMTILARALVSETHYDEASRLLLQALSIQERVYGKVHPRVASALNEVGKVAQKQGKLDDAEAAFQRMENIYRSVYGDQHYLIAVAMSNRGSVSMDRGEFAKAEAIFREVVQRFTTALSATHLNTGIARIKLGRSLLKQRKYADAEPESRAGYDILAQQANPSLSWLKNAREDLVEEYDALHEPEKAAAFKSELATAKPNAVSVAAK
jgi:serine/threonine-protein kinase